MLYKSESLRKLAKLAVVNVLLKLAGDTEPAKREDLSTAGLVNSPEARRVAEAARQSTDNKLVPKATELGQKARARIAKTRANCVSKTPKDKDSANVAAAVKESAPGLQRYPAVGKAVERYKKVTGNANEAIKRLLPKSHRAYTGNSNAADRQPGYSVIMEEVLGAKPKTTPTKTDTSAERN